jgi:hypothetical protein
MEARASRGTSLEKGLAGCYLRRFSFSSTTL